MKHIVLVILLCAIMLSSVLVSCGPDPTVNELKESQNITLVGYRNGIGVYRFIDGDRICYLLIGHGRDGSAIDCM